MPDHTNVWVHGEKVSARGEVLWAVWGEICFQLEKKHFCNCPRGAFEIPSLCGVGAAGTDQEMLQQQHQHFIILSGAKGHFVGIQNFRLPH